MSHTPDLVDELAAFDRLLEVGVGRRRGVARALAARGRDVVAVDVDPDAVDPEAIDPDAVDGAHGTASDPGTLRFRRGDVVALADAADPLDALAGRTGDGAGDDDAGDTGDVGPDGDGGIDAVYGLHLPAELQRPTVRLARRLDAACLFTTLGFEEPIVPVERRTLEGRTLYVAAADSGGPGP